MNYDSLDAPEDSEMGESFFTGRFCGAWITKYSTLTEFDDSYNPNFDRKLLSEKIEINFTEEKYLEINAKYNSYNGMVRTDREPVYVGSWDYFSSVNDTISINYADIWWQDQENGDDSCEWTFTLVHNGVNVDSTTEPCNSDGTTLSQHTYDLNFSLSVLEGDHIQIEIIYEGWNDVRLYYGSENHPSGFSISGLVSSHNDSSITTPNIIPHWNYSTPLSKVGRVSMSLNGENIVVCSGSSIRLFNQESNVPLWSYTIGSIKLVEMSSDGQYFVVIGGNHSMNRTHEGTRITTRFSKLLNNFSMIMFF